MNTWIFLNIFFQIREYLWMFKEYFWHRKIERIFTNIFFDIFDKRIFTNIYGHLWINIDQIHKYLSIFIAWIFMNIYWIFSEKVQWIFINIHRYPRLWLTARIVVDIHRCSHQVVRKSFEDTQTYICMLITFYLYFSEKARWRAREPVSEYLEAYSY